MRETPVHGRRRHRFGCRCLRCPGATAGSDVFVEGAVTQHVIAPLHRRGGHSVGCDAGGAGDSYGSPLRRCGRHRRCWRCIGALGAARRLRRRFRVRPLHVYWRCTRLWRRRNRHHGAAGAGAGLGTPQPLVLVHAPSGCRHRLRDRRAGAAGPGPGGVGASALLKPTCQRDGSALQAPDGNAFDQHAREGSSGFRCRPVSPSSIAPLDRKLHPARRAEIDSAAHSFA